MKQSNNKKGKRDVKKQKPWNETKPNKIKQMKLCPKNVGVLKQ